MVSAVCSMDVFLVVQLVEALRSFCFLDLNLRSSDLPLNPLVLSCSLGLRLGMGLHFGCCLSGFLPEGPASLCFSAGHPASPLSFLSLTSGLFSLWCFLSFPSARRLPCDLGSPCRRQSSSLFCFGLRLPFSCVWVPSRPLFLLLQHLVSFSQACIGLLLVGY